MFTKQNILIGTKNHTDCILVSAFFMYLSNPNPKPLP